jgi:hypothetical protein
MSTKKESKNFHAIYDNNTLKNMKRYYGIDSDDEIVKYIKRNRLAEADERGSCITKELVRI